MRAILCLLLCLPGLAFAGQSNGSEEVALQVVPTRVSLARPVSRAGLAKPVAARSPNVDPPGMCESAVIIAEAAQHLPARLLGAISLTETGRIDPKSGAFRPWPWSINAEGTGQFFASAQEAIDAVKALQDKGVQSIDVGCLQINLMFHPNAFATLEDAFDPRKNALYAARFLNALYTDSKDWGHAIAAYHSETPALGEPYRALVMARWQNPDVHDLAPARRVAYGDFANSKEVYNAFAPPQRVYGAFTPGPNSELIVGSLPRPYN